MSERVLSLAMVRIGELAIQVGAAPINQWSACWEHQVDAEWWVAVNGHTEPHDTSEGVTVPPFTAYITFNGWPFGLLNPFEGSLGRGEAANEDTFIAAVEAALLGSRGTPA